MVEFLNVVKQRPCWRQSGDCSLETAPRRWLTQRRLARKDRITMRRCPPRCYEEPGPTRIRVRPQMGPNSVGASSSGSGGSIQEGVSPRELALDLHSESCHS